jgi:hypothetical protein
MIWDPARASRSCVLAALAARVDIPIKISQVRQPFYGKAVLVLFTFDVSFQEIFRQPIAHFVSERSAREP